MIMFGAEWTLKSLAEIIVAVATAGVFVTDLGHAQTKEEGEFYGKNLIVAIIVASSIYTTTESLAHAAAALALFYAIRGGILKF